MALWRLGGTDGGDAAGGVGGDAGGNALATSSEQSIEHYEL